MLSTLINRPCTLIQRKAGSARNRHGDKVKNETVVQTVCELQQRSRKEEDGKAELSDTGWRAYFLPDIRPRTGDVLIVDSEEYEVIGDPWVARNPRTKLVEHVEASLRRTAGPGDEVGS